MSDEERATVTLRLPSTLSAYSGGKSQIRMKADTVEQLLAALERLHPLVWERLCTDANAGCSSCLASLPPHPFGHCTGPDRAYPGYSTFTFLACWRCFCRCI